MSPENAEKMKLTEKITGSLLDIKIEKEIMLEIELGK